MPDLKHRRMFRAAFLSLFRKVRHWVEGTDRSGRRRRRRKVSRDDDDDDDRPREHLVLTGEYSAFVPFLRELTDMVPAANEFQFKTTTNPDHPHPHPHPGHPHPGHPSGSAALEVLLLHPYPPPIAVWRKAQRMGRRVRYAPGSPSIERDLRRACVQSARASVFLTHRNAESTVAPMTMTTTDHGATNQLDAVYPSSPR